MGDIKIRVYPASFPRRGWWVLEWQSSVMRAPAFFYYKTKIEAEAQARRLYTTIRNARAMVENLATKLKFGRS